MRVEPVAKSVRWATSRPDTLAHLGLHFAPELARFNFKLVDQTPDRMVFKERYLPPIGAFIGLITFPLGILFWVFWRKENVLTFTLIDDGPCTRLVIAGQAGRAIADYVEAIPDTTGQERVLTGSTGDVAGS